MKGMIWSESWARGFGNWGCMSAIKCSCDGWQKEAFLLGPGWGCFLLTLCVQFVQVSWRMMLIFALCAQLHNLFGLLVLGAWRQTIYLFRMDLIMSNGHWTPLMVFHMKNLLFGFYQLWKMWNEQVLKGVDYYWRQNWGWSATCSMIISEFWRGTLRSLKLQIVSFLVIVLLVVTSFLVMLLLRDTRQGLE